MERSGRLKQKGHGCLEEQLVGISLSAQRQQWSCKTQRKSGCLVQHVSPFHSPMSVHKGGSTRLASCPFCLPNDLASLSCQVTSSIYSAIDHLQNKLKCPSCNPLFSSPALGLCHAKTAAPQDSAGSSQQQGAVWWAVLSAAGLQTAQLTGNICNSPRRLAN